MSDNPLAREWALLQTQCGHYESLSLIIKLLAVAMVAASLLMSANPAFLIGALVAILWLQDAIWKTFQSRLETRLLQLESLLTQDADKTQSYAFQLHTQFQTRRRQGGLLRQYLTSAIRPTIAYPYVALLVVLAGSTLL